MKGIIFYTDSMIDEPIKSVVQKYVQVSGLPIVSVSLAPLDFGRNIVVEGKRGYVTYIKQIITALEASNADHVFFVEHDCLYPKCHFDFTPPRDDIYYYNRNVYRWKYGSYTAITYDRLLNLSCMCCNRLLALSHYRLIEEKICDNPNKFNSKEPSLARKMGYEPGTKKKKRGGLTDEDFDTWCSEYPVVDIRHEGTFSPPKCTLSSFRHAPSNWQEILVGHVPGWNLLEMFK